jgi:hypothetical protein
MTRSLVIAAALLALASACKEKQAATPAPPATPAGSSAAAPRPAPVAAPGDAATRPSLPTPLPAPEGTPVTIEDAKKLLPAIIGKEILGLKQTSDGRQVHGTWCLDGDGAEDVAKMLGKLMADAGYSALSIRGDAKKAGVQGDRDGYRMSMVVSASSAANCPAPQHYFASATIFRL